MNARADTILEIARMVLCVKTLEVRNLDSLDFHDLNVVRIREALEEAYDAGYEAGRKASIM